MDWKRGFVASALTRIGKISADVDIPINGSDQVYEYRNRVLLRCYIDNDGERSQISFGYFKRSSRELVAIEFCRIASPIINQILSTIKKSFDTDLVLQKISSQKIRMELQEIPKRGVTIVLYPTEGDKQDLVPLKECFKKLPNVLWVGTVFELDEAPMFAFEEVFEDSKSFVFSTSPGVFQQVNIDLNKKLRHLVTQYAVEKKSERILDLFCGSGNLSLMMSEKKRYIEGIETNPYSIKCANNNVVINELPNSHYFKGDTEAHLWKCAKKGEQFDLVLTDPPREGMYKSIIPLLKIFPKNIVYISCDPATLARDLGSLCGKGYKIEKIEVFDFFPNTYHVETAVFLERD